MMGWTEAIRRAEQLASAGQRAGAIAAARGVVEAGRYREATAVCRAALARMPGNPAFVSVLFNAASQLCEVDEVWRDLEGMSRVVPDHLETLSQLCCTANAASTATPAEV